MADWKKIKKEYIAGEISYRKLAEKHKVSFGTLSKRAAQEKWSDLKKKTGDKTDAKIVESVSDQNAKVENKIYTTADKLLEKLIAAVNSLTPAEIKKDKKGFRSLTSALADIKSIKDMKSEKDDKEQDARIRALEKKLEKENLSSDAVEVIMNEELEEYSQ